MTTSNQSGEIKYITCNDIQKAQRLIETFSDSYDKSSIDSLHIKVSSEFQQLDINKNDAVINIYKNRSLILRLSFNDKTSIFWKWKKYSNFFILEKINGISKADSELMHEFVIQSLIKWLKSDHPGLQSGFIQNLKDQYQLCDLEDAREMDILFIVVEEGNLKIAKILLKLQLKSRYSLETVAWTNRDSDMLILLSKSNYLYPNGINKSQLSERFEKFYKITDDLHAAVRNMNEDGVRAILEKNYFLSRHFLNLQNKSAMKIAIEEDALNICGILHEFDLALAPHELESGADCDSPFELSKNSSTLKRRVIRTLIENSRIADDILDIDGKLTYILEAYNLMRRDKCLESVLEFLATSNKIELIYDFSKDQNSISIEKTEDGQQILTVGVSQLLSERTKVHSIAIIARELFRLALTIKFKNNGKPYEESDEQMRLKFQQICVKCQASKGLEKSIDGILARVSEKEQHSELIACVPYLTVLNYDNPEGLFETRELFSRLFSFAEDVAQILGGKKRKRERRIKRSSIVNLCALAFIALFITFSYLSLNVIQFKKPCRESLSGNDLNKIERIQEKDVIFKGTLIKFNELFRDRSFNLGTQIYRQLNCKPSSDFWNSPINLSENKFNFLSNFIMLNFTTFNNELRAKILESNFTFQNKTIKLNQLYQKVPQVFEDLSSKQLTAIFNGENITLGSIVQVNRKSFIERLFLFNESVESISSIILSAEQQKFIIMLAKVGSGKSTTFNHLAVKVKKQNPLKWVLLIKLGDFVEKDILNDSFGNPINVLKRISGLNLENIFEVRVFQELFYANDLVIFWDGFDEVPEEEIEFVIEIMNFVWKNTKNVQYVSTTTLHSEKLQRTFNITPHAMLPFGKYQKRKFFENITGSKAKFESEKILEIPFIDNPLLLKSFSQILEGMGNFGSLNLYVMFDAFVKQQFAYWQAHYKFNNSTIDENRMRQIYQKYALLNEFPEIFTTKKLKLKVFQISIPKEVQLRHVAQMGILDIIKKGDENEKFEFINRAFAHFFVTQYLIENFYMVESRTDDIQIMLQYEIKWSPLILDFIFDFLRHNSRTKIDY